MKIKTLILLIALVVVSSCGSTTTKVQSNEVVAWLHLKFKG